VNTRLADRSDIPEIAGLHVRTALVAYAHIFPPEAPVPTEDELRARWSGWVASAKAFVAVDDGEVVGVVLSGPDPDAPNRGHLSRLYVAPERWGEGIGRRLYDTCLAHLRGRRFGDATLWVLEENTRARAWYERLGWRPTGATKPVYAPARIDDVHYRLDLDTPTVRRD